MQRLSTFFSPRPIADHAQKHSICDKYFQIIKQSSIIANCHFSYSMIDNCFKNGQTPTRGRDLPDCRLLEWGTPRNTDTAAPRSRESFTVIYGHLGSFTAIYGHLRSFTTVNDHLRPSTVIYGHLGSFTAIYDHVREFAVIYDPSLFQNDSLALIPEFS